MKKQTYLGLVRRNQGFRVAAAAFVVDVGSAVAGFDEAVGDDLVFRVAAVFDLALFDVAAEVDDDVVVLYVAVVVVAAALNYIVVFNAAVVVVVDVCVFRIDSVVNYVAV
jgi:hypothetical protein